MWALIGSDFYIVVRGAALGKPCLERIADWSTATWFVGYWQDSASCHELGGGSRYSFDDRSLGQLYDTCPRAKIVACLVMHSQHPPVCTEAVEHAVGQVKVHQHIPTGPLLEMLLRHHP